MQNQTPYLQPKHTGFSLFKKIDPEDFSQRMDMKKNFLGIQKHLLLIMLSMIVFGLAGLYFCYTLQTNFEAKAIVLYQQEEQTSKNIEGGFTITTLSLPTVLDMITQPAHFETLKKNLGLQLEPSKIQAMVYVPKPKNNSNLIHIVARTKNPHLSMDLVNNLAKIAVKSTQDFTRRQLKTALEVYENQLEVVRKSATIQNDQLEKFKQENQYFDMKPEETSFLTRVENARKSRDNAALEYRSVLIQYENLKKEINNIPQYTPVSSKSKDSHLQTRIASLETTLAEARAKYTKNNPKLLQLEEELNALLNHSKAAIKNEKNDSSYEKNALRDKLELELVHLQGKVKSSRKIRDKLNEKAKLLEQQLQTFPAQQMALVKLLQAKDMTADRLKDSIKAVDAAKMMIESPRGSIELYQPAIKATSWQDSSWLELIPVLGLLFGTGVGVVAAFIIEVNDNKICTEKQLELFYGVPCIECIPEIRGIKKSTAESKLIFFIRNLAEYIDKEKERRNIKDPSIIALTSSVANEGKSLLATLTASYYARFGKKIILVEMDYKNNSFTEKEKIGKKTIFDYLNKNASLDEITIRGTYDRLSVQKKEPSMKELLKTKNAEAFWKDLRSNYDMVILDTPGIIEEDYASDLINAADLTVLVSSSSTSSKSTLDETLKIIEPSSSTLCGIILNRINTAYISDRRLLLEMKRINSNFLTKLFRRA